MKENSEYMTRKLKDSNAFKMRKHGKQENIARQSVSTTKLSALTPQNTEYA